MALRLCALYVRRCKLLLVVASLVINGLLYVMCIFNIIIQFSSCKGIVANVEKEFCFATVSEVLKFPYTGVLGDAKHLASKVFISRRRIKHLFETHEYPWDCHMVVSPNDP